MSRKTKIVINIAVILAAFMLFSSIGAAANLDLLTTNDDARFQELLTKSIEEKIKRGAYFLLGIGSKINTSEEDLTLLKGNIRTLKNKISDSQIHIEDLKSQISNIDRLIAENEEKIAAGTVLVAEYENGISVVERDIAQKKEDLEKQFKSLDIALNTYYLQNNVFFETSDQSPLLLAFLSSDETTGEVLKQNQYLFFLQNASQQLAQKIEQGQKELAQDEDLLAWKKEKTLELQEMLQREKKNLQDAQESRTRLLAETQGKQMVYETLLELSKKEESQVADTIEKLKGNYGFFEQKLAELKNNPQTSSPSFDFDDNDQVLKGSTPLAWPISPSQGLTAYFHDSAYEKAMGIPHNAIDIRISQGSPVKAPADGVVTKVADNGFAYSYIIMGHAENILTLYGHMSEIFVREGDVVKQGQMIGLSGGIPGTKGAGWLTTGAHLHFEVFKDFKHVDPLEYLPLEYVPLNSLPEKYLNRITGEEKKIQRPLEL